MKNEYELNYFNFKKFNHQYLLTNDAGRFKFLDSEEFKKMIKHELDNTEVYNDLKQRFFIIDENKEIFIRSISDKIQRRRKYLFARTQLHIFILSINCNLSCRYCQASVKDGSKKEGNMNLKVAERSVDIAFESQSRYLSFEFQGGEPLLNYQVLKHIVEYTKRKMKLI